MRTCLICLLLVAVMLSSGCAITHDHKSAAGIKEATTINIIENPDTRAGFLAAMKSWLDSHGYKYNVLPRDGDRAHGWVLTYNGEWTWDVTIYMAKAAINAFKDGVETGYATYDVQGGCMSYNLSKWRNAEETIKKMMSNLYDQMKDTK